MITKSKIAIIICAVFLPLVVHGVSQKLFLILLIRENIAFP